MYENAVPCAVPPSSYVVRPAAEHVGKKKEVKIISSQADVRNNYKYRIRIKIYRENRAKKKVVASAAC